MMFKCRRRRRINVFLTGLLLITIVLTEFRNKVSIFFHSVLYFNKTPQGPPQLDINNSDIIKFMEHVDPVVCPGENLVKINGSQAYITEETQQNLGNVECDFSDILRVNDYRNSEGPVKLSSRKYDLEESDFIHVNCSSDFSEHWYTVMAGIRHSEDIVQRIGWEKVPEDGLYLNVLILGIASVSRLMFARKLPRTFNYLQQTLNAFDMEGYNIIGDGIHESLIPILTGFTETELPITQRLKENVTEGSYHVNIYPMIWNDFQRNGYVTGFAEDCAQFATFNHRLKGFNSQPTDHYMRPFYIEAEKLFKTYAKYCLGSIPRHKIIMNYILDFFRVYRLKPKFMFGFLSELSQSSPNLIGAMDGDVMQWLKTLKEEGHLDDTLLIIMSDHGLRYGDIRNTEQGQLEERLPKLSLALPSRLMPRANDNLRHNTRVLTTPFDVHATLVDVVHFQGLRRGDLRQRSISLFREIPAQRSCEHAQIHAHWCTFLNWTRLDPILEDVQLAAKEAVKKINEITDENAEKCMNVHLDFILEARLLVPTTGYLRFYKNIHTELAKVGGNLKANMFVYQVKIATQPGDALYEITVTYYVKEENFLVSSSEISRINSYEPHVTCLKTTELHLRKYCFCFSDQ